MVMHTHLECGSVGLSPGQMKSKTIKLVFVASPLRSKSKDWLAGIQDNVSEWGDISTLGPLFQ
jgi:hypothetical protein